MAHHFFDAAPHFRPYRWASPQMQVGLRPISTRDWLILDDNYSTFMDTKRSHLTCSARRCYKTSAGTLAAQAELRNMVVRHLVTDHSDRFSLSERILTSSVDGHCWNLDEDGVEPLWQLSQVVQEDFMLLQEIAGRLLVTAAANAYSSSGRLVAAVGQDMRWAHEPVPELTSRLGARIDKILATVHEDALGARFNWQLTPLTTLFFPEDPHAANRAALEAVSAQLSRNPSLAPELLQIRVERQTLRRLPETRAIAFSIHTYSDPLSSISSDAQSVQALLALLKDYPPARLRYNEMDTIQKAVIAWLQTLPTDRQ